MNQPGKCHRNTLSLSLFFIFAFCAANICFSKNVKVQNISELRAALKSISAGSIIEILPGYYAGGFGFANIHGRPDAPIIIAGADMQNPPVFQGQGQGEGFKVSSSSYLKFINIAFRGFSTNGINIDDGGNTGQPSHHILLERIRIENIGTNGIHNALKMSGVNHFIVRRLLAVGWGGAGIDLVGCHNGVIESSRFVHKEGFRTANSIQIKGGSRAILVQNNLFENSGSRIVQIGGSTGLAYFRPSIQNYEAKGVIVAGNTFIGGEAQVTLVTAQDSYVHHNLFYKPQKWIGRILQESVDSRFLPCQRGFFEKNLMVLDERVRAIFNIGKGTMPESFIFRGNVWNLSSSKVGESLPSAEIGGSYGLDPALQRLQDGQFVTVSRNPLLRSVGPWAYRSTQYTDDLVDIHLPTF